MGPDPAVAAVRLAVRRAISGLGPGSLTLAACSGGADSLALAAALAFEAPRLGQRAGAVTVDHGLQEGSAAQAGRVAEVAAGLGLDPVLRVTASVPSRPAPAGPAPAGPAPAGPAPAGPAPAGPVRAGSGPAGPGAARYPGPEAAARQARYAAIDRAAQGCGAVAVLLGHTMDDQAETVLLGLARGSGARSLAGMDASAGRYLRPLLGVRRAQTAAACAALGLRAWDDPQNADPAFARNRVRLRVLPLLEEQLGPGITEALARTAGQLRADAGLLDGLAAEAAGRLMADWPAAGRSLDVAGLAALPEPIRSRVLRLAAIAAGAPPGALTAGHVADLDALVTRWRGQRWADLPAVRCARRCGRLHFTTRSENGDAGGRHGPGR